MKLITYKAKEIKEIIALTLGNELNKFEFFYKKTENEFICKDGEFKFIFNMLLTAWSDHYSLDTRLFISQEKVESIYEKIVGKSHKLTIGNTFSRIYKSPDGREIINGSTVILLIQNDDIEAACETLERYFNNTARPYFEKYRTLEDFDNIINNPPFDHCPAHVGGNFDERCMKGLIIARLVNNPNYDALVNIYDEAIKETMDKGSIENYYKVRDYLIYNRIN